ncbi:class I SAM-dependent methyltransferase [Kribbella shirazensis]|uniref:2-polyprenyl-3-methyl-5-hydroxy-6-metoxy-1, 4-benzoquinol methylase n=1 Tax=Kribbella shirazensis TaxID=1105143 RepID=A0A7X5V5K9_9ACTN|nr:class I SAM-dependent methyltransferase [Kribbella shirazensis]NIK55044.1 2-polyprenyl-3-methyl-5-hydroxy-6-metoxy-1,4-benzoquinol methylase [Kribbella shirazensis]
MRDEAVCILCAARGSLRRRFDKDGYGIAECLTCGLVQLQPTPTPETLRALYETDSYFDGVGSGYSEYESQEEEYLATFREDVRRIAEFVPSGKVLEVGCGYGYFLQCALEAGYDAYGIDLSPTAIKWASERLPDRVFCGLLEEVPQIQKQQYDVIFGSHLIEHLTEPAAFLESAARLLRPGGVIVLVTPNIRSLLSRASGRRWVSYKIPEHVSYYDPRTITDLLDRTGFSVRAVDSAYQYYALPFVAKRVRELLHPVSRLVPPIERLSGLRTRHIRVTSGSMRVVAVR